MSVVQITPELLLGILALIVAVAALWISLVRLQKQKLLDERQRHWQRHMVDRADQLSSTGVGMGRRLLVLEQLVDQMNTPDESLDELVKVAQSPVIPEQDIPTTFVEPDESASEWIASETTASGDALTAPGGLELQEASSLLGAGISPEEVARRCGISRAEANLLQLMRQKKGSSAA